MTEADAPPFDFAGHQKTAVAEYLKVQPFFDDLAAVVARVIEECIKKRGIKVHRVEHRSKSPTSFGRKAAIPSEANPNAPKYTDPLKQITDLAGVRVITFFPSTLADVDALLRSEFDVIERSDKGEELLEEERFGYQSIHYLLRLTPARAALAEYERFSGAVTELQVRTILQHAWAEIEHDIQYKSSATIPAEIRRRFMALAGVLEIADREFQAIQDTDRELTSQARALVKRGALEGVEVTPDALKLFLDRRLGPDGRIAEWTYSWTARLLKRFGFRDLKQVEAAIAPYNDDRLSQLALGGRQGQTRRFELMLLAALGEAFIERHFFRGQGWFDPRERSILERFRENGIEVGRYDPAPTPEVPAPETPKE